MRHILNRFRTLYRDDVSALLIMWSATTIITAIAFALVGNVFGIPIGIAVALVLLVAMGMF